MNRRNFMISGVAVSIPLATGTTAFADSNYTFLENNFDKDIEEILGKSLERYQKDVNYVWDWMDIFQQEVTHYMKNVWKNWKSVEDVIMTDLDGTEKSSGFVNDPNFYDSVHLGGTIVIKYKDGKDIDIRTWGFKTVFDHPYIDHIKVVCNYCAAEKKIDVVFEPKDD